MREKKLTVLTFLSNYLPGYKSGGPVQSIANLVDALGDEFQFRVVTADRDLGGQTTYKNIHTGRWYAVGKAEVLYLPPLEQSLRGVARILRDTPHDRLYLNSFFNPRFTTLPLLVRHLGLAPKAPIILAPRGEFSVSALEIKARRKRGFIAFCKAVGLHRGLTWQASSAYEMADIRRVMGEQTANIYVASDLPRAARPGAPHHVRPSGTALRIVFLSRVAPMKNLLLALQVLLDVRVPVRFTIIGPREDLAYWARCAELIAKLPPNIKIDVQDGVPSFEVVDRLAKHDLFFLPTLGENFGHVIAEALEAGIRLLISDRTPWRGLAEAGVGYALSLDDPAAFRAAIEAEATAPRVDPAITTARAHAYLEAQLNRDQVTADNRQLLAGAD